MTNFIGVISDTHGLLRPQVIEALQGCHMIIHAGDIGNQSIIDNLNKIAPVVAVRGNIDKGDWGNQFPHYQFLEYQGKSIHVLHNLSELDLDLTEAKPDIIISGHSHQPLIEEKEHIHYFNPGSVGPRRFKLPVTMGRIEIIDGRIQSKIIKLAV